MVSASIVALRLVRPDVVDAISPCSAAASDVVRTLEPVTLEPRAVSVVNRRLISQSPKARRVSTVAPALTAAAWVAQTPLPAGPAPGSPPAAGPARPDDPAGQLAAITADLQAEVEIRTEVVAVAHAGREMPDDRIFDRPVELGERE